MKKFSSTKELGLKGGPNYMKLSTAGYRMDSPDRFNPMNVIPSGHISMHGVNHPVVGIDNLGNQEMMYPGNEYVFPGSMVTEFPMMQNGGDPGKDGMMKARMAYEYMHGNPAIRRMVAPVDEPYLFPNGYTGTHYMSSVDDYAVPFIQQTKNGLRMLPETIDPRNTPEAMKFENAEDADYFARNYKNIAPAFRQEGGDIESELDFKAHEKYQKAKELYDQEMNDYAKKKDQVSTYLKKLPLQKAVSLPAKEIVKTEALAQNRFGGFVDTEMLNPTQDLKTKSRRTINSLKDAIRKGEYIEPIEVQKTQNGLDILDGHHRYTAYKELGEQAPIQYAKSGGWIQDAVKRPGAFTEKANDAGMSVQEYARHVLAENSHASERTKRQAVLAQTFKKMVNKKAFGGDTKAPQNVTTDGIIKYRNDMFKNKLSQNAYNAFTREEADILANDMMNFMQMGGGYNPNQSNVSAWVNAYGTMKNQASDDFNNFLGESGEMIQSIYQNPSEMTLKKMKTTLTDPALKEQYQQYKTDMRQNLFNQNQSDSFGQTNAKRQPLTFDQMQQQFGLPPAYGCGGKMYNYGGGHLPYMKEAGEFNFEPRNHYESNRITPDPVDRFDINADIDNYLKGAYRRQIAGNQSYPYNQNQGFIVTNPAGYPVYNNNTNGYNLFPTNTRWQRGPQQPNFFSGPAIAYNPNATYLNKVDTKYGIFGRKPRRVTMEFDHYGNPGFPNTQNAESNRLSTPDSIPFNQMMNAASRANVEASFAEQMKPSTDAVEVTGVPSAMPSYNLQFGGRSNYPTQPMYPGGHPFTVVNAIFQQGGSNIGSPSTENPWAKTTGVWKKGMAGTGQDWADWGLAGMSMLSSLGEGNERKALEEQMKQRMLGDAVFEPMGAGDASRGTWTVNRGDFRPDQQTPVQYQGWNQGMIGSPMVQGRYGGQYQEGGEYYMTDAEIEQFMAMGGSIEYLD